MLAHGHQNNQAVFVLKGKPLNVWELKRDEIYNLMQALNVEDNPEGLRSDKVILATDADGDGLPIRNLMIPFFSSSLSNLSMTVRCEKQSRDPRPESKV